VQDAIAGCDADRQKVLHDIVLTGTTSLIPGLPERLRNELSSLTEPEVYITASTHRADYPWLGGSILGSLGDFEYMCVTREEYEEHGPSIVDQMYL
jgi:actin-related protein